MNFLNLDRNLNPLLTYDPFKTPHIIVFGLKKITSHSYAYLQFLTTVPKSAFPSCIIFSSLTYVSVFVWQPSSCQQFLRLLRTSFLLLLLSFFQRHEDRKLLLPRYTVHFMHWRSSTFFFFSKICFRKFSLRRRTCVKSLYQRF